MTDEELGRIFRCLVTIKGSRPEYHRQRIEKLRTDFPLLYGLIQLAQKEEELWDG